jgi:DNA transformation protein
MNLSHAYLDRILAQLAQVAGITHRRIFSGAGLYYQGVQFALVVNDRLYFCTDEHSRPLYQQQGMGAFQPRLATQVESRFYQVPEKVFNQPAELHHWLRIAIESASAAHIDDSNSDDDNSKDDADFSSHSNPGNDFIPRQVRA